MQKTNTINKGFKFNLHQNPKHWLKTLDLDAAQLLAIYLPFIQISLEFK